jgi:tRNA nucleotidyltransferase (CCA-adding enzyme)
MVAVADLFTDVVFQLTPSESELARARQHRDAIKQRMPFPGIVEFINTGSYIKGTAIRPFDDIDLFVAIDPTEYDGQPTKILTRLAFHLRASYPVSWVRTQEHSVGITFASGTRVDIVPGFLNDGGNGYVIRNRRDRTWVQTDPNIHKEFFNRRQDQDRRFREIIRLVKHWKRHRRKRWGSYLIELLLTHWADEQGIPIGRDVALYEFFNWVLEQDWASDTFFFDDYYSENELPDRTDTPMFVLDPANPENNVAQNVTAADLQGLLNAAKFARRRSRAALNASSRTAAARIWRELLPVFPRP